MRTPFLPVESTTLEGNPEGSDLLATEQFSRCAYCNTKLLFTHDLNLHFFEVIENCRCPGCGVTKSPQRFTLQ